MASGFVVAFALYLESHLCAPLQRIEVRTKTLRSNDCAAVRRRRKATLEERSPPLPGQELRTLGSRMRKLIAFVGLLGVIYALALQHGVFNRAAAPSLSEAQAQPSQQAPP